MTPQQVLAEKNKCAAQISIALQQFRETTGFHVSIIYLAEKMDGSGNVAYQYPQLTVQL